uniref:BMA-TBC-3, isoform h n=1 Tax=Brugia malayi TaxID=6279 RepID=A0A1I9G200_BRUMA|nr:BMA-TBC-3, isoform h [Brugia malayi]
MSTLTLALVMLLLLLNSKRRKADQMQLFNSKLVLDMRHISIWEIDNEINSNRLKGRKYEITMHWVSGFWSLNDEECLTYHWMGTEMGAVNGWPLIRFHILKGG